MQDIKGADFAFFRHDLELNLAASSDGNLGGRDKSTQGK